MGNFRDAIQLVEAKRLATEQAMNNAVSKFA